MKSESENKKKLTEQELLEIKASNSWNNTRANREDRKCLMPGCSNWAIQSHLLKKKGIVDQISTDNHVYELRTNRHRRSNNYYDFDRVGLDSAFTAKIYCNSCDTKLFRIIEEPLVLNPSNLAEACAYSLRPIGHEIRKKQGNNDWLIESGQLKRFPMIFPNFIPNQLNMNDASINALTVIHNKFLDNSDDVEFFTKEITSNQVCASSILLWPLRIPRAIHDDPHELVRYLHEPQNLSFNIINIMPGKNNGYLFISTFKNDDTGMRFIDKVKSASESELNMLLSDILIHGIEDWCVSHKLYQSKGEAIISKVQVAKNNPSGFFGESKYDFFS